jgi:3-phosphoglycerate kinase
MDAESLDLCRELLVKAEQKGVGFELPVDIVTATELSPDAATVVMDADKIPAERMGADIGPKTREKFRNFILNAGTVVWNGPMGVFELAPFASGTKAIAQAMADSRAVTIVGGGKRKHLQGYLPSEQYQPCSGGHWISRFPEEFRCSIHHRHLFGMGKCEVLF